VFSGFVSDFISLSLCLLYVYHILRSNRLTTAAAINQFLDNLPSGSDASGSEEEDEAEDIDFFAHRRDRGLEPQPQPGAGMFGDRYFEEVDEDEVDQAGEDEAGRDVAGDDEAGDEAGRDEAEGEEVSDDEQLPDLDVSVPARGIISPRFKNRSKRVISFLVCIIFCCVVFILQLLILQGEPSKKKPRQERKTWTWSSGDLPPKDMPHNSVKPKGMDQCRYPVDYFLEIFGQATFELLLEQTNIHRVDVNKKIIRISMGELRQAVGILMYMSVISMPNMRLFWKKSNNITAVSKVMTRDRFFEIVNCLHLSNNHLQPARGELGYDKLFKVRQLLTLLNINFQNHAEMEKVVSVDEQMIPYKGTVTLKVYMKNKPSKWGIKVRYCM
jgi:hypothetical protein